MHQTIKNRLKKTSLTIKMLLITLLAGISIWVILDIKQPEKLKSIFLTQLDERLSQQARVDRFLYDNYINLFKHTAKQITALKNFNDYVGNTNWSEEGDISIKQYTKSPPWFPKRSVMRSLAIPNFTLLMDSEDRVREVYINSDETIPVSLLKPSKYLIQLSHYQSYMTLIENKPFLITSEPVMSHDGRLLAKIMLASSIDDQFLASAQRSAISTGIVVIIGIDEPALVIASSRPDIIPSGTRVDSLADDYLITGQKFFDYGGSNLRSRFVSLIPTDEVNVLTGQVLNRVRSNTLFTSVIFIICFSFLMLWITQRVTKLNQKVIDFERDELNIKDTKQIKGDVLYVLENRFNRFIKDIKASRAQLQSESYDLLMTNEKLDATIDKLNKTNEELIASEANFRNAQKIAHIGNWDWDIISNTISWSDEIYRIFGVKPNEFKIDYEAHLSFIHPEDKDYVVRSFDLALNNNRPFSIDHRIVLPDGSIKIVHEQAEIYYDDGKPARIAGTLQDITERIKVEEELKDIRAILQTAMDYSQAGIAIADAPDGKIRYVNKTGLIISGKTKEEIVENVDINKYVESWQMFNFDGKPLKDDEVPLARAIMYGEANSREMIIRKADDENRVVLANAAPVLDDNGNVKAGIGIFLDITEQKKIEAEKENLWKQLLQSQKLESVGRLTGGIAHDFNNLLQTTIGFSSMLCSQMSDDDPQKDMVKRIHKSGEKASKLIEQLLVFSRKQALDIKTMDPNIAIESVLDMCTRMVGENVSLSAELAPSIDNIMADETQVEQVLMNLIVNARDALPMGGEIKVKTKNVRLDEESIKRFPELKVGEYVELSVKDNGNGISKDIIKNIFDPFFSTKEEGKGTGLGLSTVFGIVKQHNGAIYVDSEVNIGTEFKVYFPVSKYEIPAPEEDIDKITVGNETILITEDDPDVMTLFASSLEAEGYKVLKAENGEKALQNIVTYEGNIDILLSDVVMPGMDGFELAKEIVKSRPSIKTLFVSGFIGDSKILSTLKNGRIPYIKKPVTPKELASKVRQVLDS